MQKEGSLPERHPPEVDERRAFHHIPSLGSFSVRNSAKGVTLKGLANCLDMWLNSKSQTMPVALHQVLLAAWRSGVSYLSRFLAMAAAQDAISFNQQIGVPTCEMLMPNLARHEDQMQGLAGKSSELSRSLLSTRLQFACMWKGRCWFDLTFRLSEFDETALISCSGL